MIENMHRSSEAPDFDTYPASPSAVKRIDQLEGNNRSPLEERAAELGAAAGKVVYMVRQARATVEGLNSHALLDRINELAENAVTRADHLRALAAHRTQEWTQAAREKTAELSRQAKSGYERARHRANRLAREYPVHLALIAGATGFLLGMAFRIRRARAN